jgi:hypothetical protein
MSNTEKHVKDIRRKTRRKFSSEEKIKIVLDGFQWHLGGASPSFFPHHRGFDHFYSHIGGLYER